MATKTRHGPIAAIYKKSCHLPGKLNQGKSFTGKREKMRVIFKKRKESDAFDIS